jgi:hypothetical protein
MSLAFSLQTDGQLEVTNQVITMYLRCLAGDRPHSWIRWLPWAEYCYNTSYQTALKTTPFQVVYGRPPSALIPFQVRSTRVVAVDHQLHDRDIFLAEIKNRLLQAQALMKTSYDKNHCELEFAMGDWAWLCLNHCAATTIRESDYSKLGPKYFGPYEVCEKIGSVSYRLRLRLPAKTRIHDVFHIAFLKKFEVVSPGSVPPLPSIVRGRAVSQPDKVERARPTKDSWEVLVQWQGKTADEATWELLEQFKEDYPDFQVEDKLFLR